MKAKILEGNVLETLKDLPACSVQCVVTSPPYYGLRDYGTAEWNGGDPNCDHVDADKVAERKRQKKSMIAVGEKIDGSTRTRVHDEAIGKDWQYRDACQKCGAIRIDSQIGLEPTPEAYIEKLVHVFREVWRVLKNDGTLWLNLGDSYWGGKGQSAHGGSDKQRARFQRNESINRDYQEIGRHGWTAPKDGKHEFIKPKDLIGIPWMVAFALRADGWWLRSDIVWNKPNPMPESVEDRPTRSHEYIFLMTKSATYYYDHEAIKEPLSSASIQRLSQVNFDNQTGGAKDYQHGTNKNRSARRALVNLKGRAMPPQVADDPERWANLTGRNKRDVWTVTTKPYKEAHFATFPPDLIEPCILAGSKEGDTVLDPFNGSGTTGEVSIKHNRFYIGCELNPDYVRLTKKRLSKVQPVLPQGIRTTLPAPDGGDSAPSQSLSTPDMFSAIEHEPTPAPRR